MAKGVFKLFLLMISLSLYLSSSLCFYHSLALLACHLPLLGDVLSIRLFADDFHVFLMCKNYKWASFFAIVRVFVYALRAAIAE